MYWHDRNFKKAWLSHLTLVHDRRTKFPTDHSLNGVSRHPSWSDFCPMSIRGPNWVPVLCRRRNRTERRLNRRGHGHRDLNTNLNSNPSGSPGLLWPLWWDLLEEIVDLTVIIRQQMTCPNSTHIVRGSASRFDEWVDPPHQSDPAGFP